MIGEIESRLCDLADEYHEAGKENERKVVQKCLMIMHEVWTKSEATKTKIFDKEPSDIYEEWVLTIPGVTLYKDSHDGKYFYELDGSHFDSAKEVWNYMIEYHTGANERAKSNAKAEALKEIMLLINKWTNKYETAKKPRKAVNVRIAKVL